MPPAFSLANVPQRSQGYPVFGDYRISITPISGASSMNVFDPYLANQIISQYRLPMVLAPMGNRKFGSTHSNAIIVVVFMVSRPYVVRIEAGARDALPAMKSDGTWPESISEKVGEPVSKSRPMLGGIEDDSVPVFVDCERPNPAFIIVAGRNNAAEVVVMGFSGRLDVCHEPSSGRGTRRPRCSNSRASSILHEVGLSPTHRPTILSRSKGGY